MYCNIFYAFFDKLISISLKMFSDCVVPTRKLSYFLSNVYKEIMLSLFLILIANIDMIQGIHIKCYIF